MTCLVPVVLTLAAFAAFGSVAEVIEPEPVTTFQQTVRPFVVKYCAGCHSGDEPKAELALDAYEDLDSVLEDRESWENVLGILELGGMPPEEEPQPSTEQLEQVVAWLDSVLNAVDCSGEADPGRVTVRRLNAPEYNNTVRDLLGVDFNPADDFPADDVGYGFDNIGDVLSLSPVLMERYFRAAERIADWAIVAESWDDPTVTRFEAERMTHAGEGGRAGDETFTLYSPGRLQESFSASRDAEYVVRVRAYGDQAGPEPAKMALRFEGRELHVFDVTAEKDAPEVYETRVALGPGSLHTELVFVNDFFDREAPEDSKRDRNLIIDYLEIEGPFVPQARLASHQRIFACHPEGGHTDHCAEQIVASLVRRAYRRPATEDETTALLRFVDLAAEQGEGMERGIQLALQAMLVSPHFLFRIEGDPNPNDQGGVHALNDYVIANRLSYFLWSTMPDAELFREADRGTLSEPDVLEKQLRRMLADARSIAFVENFAGQWLQLRNLDRVTPDPEKFSGFDDALRTAMRRETELFFEAILHEDRSILDFLDADFTFLNEKLAGHYGIEGVEGEAFRRVALEGDQRGGALSQASILTITSNPTRTSPVKRGKWILENILGTPPPPPPEVAELKEDEQARLSGSLRERMQQHRANPSCAVCHVQMDALGFGFENYDAIGAWRTNDGEFEIDASGTLPRGETFDGPAALKSILRTKAEAFSRCLAEKMLTYALGRGLEPYDECALDEICRELARNDYRFSALVLEVAKSRPFLMRRDDGERE